MEITSLTSMKLQTIQIMNTDDVHAILVEVLKRENRMVREQEHFWFIGVSEDDYILCIDTIALGNGNQVAIEPMNVFRNGIWRKAKYAILAHNHPGGPLKPSEEDIDITDRLYQCGLILDLEVRDHLIISIKDYYSFKHQELMKKISESTKYVPPYKLVERALNKGIEKGREEGLIEGREEGIKKEKIEIACNMKQLNIEIEKIEKATGLTKEEIEKL